MNIEDVGRPTHFDLDKFFEVVEGFICADEIITALHMLDNMPGYYRDNPPPRAKEIKDRLYKQLWTVVDYAKDPDEHSDRVQAVHYGVPIGQQWSLPDFAPRGPIMMDFVKELNDDGFYADITEFGPANYWLPHGLQGESLQFAYKAFNINREPATTPASHITLAESKKIFCCFEVIEHLWSPDDIYHYYVKSGGDADFVFISTPMYTLYGGLPNWSERELGHIRTWTPGELVAFFRKHWGEGWDVSVYKSSMMVLKAVRKTNNKGVL